MDNFSRLVVLLPHVPAVCPHCKLLRQYQPLIVRASPGWYLSCPCSSELLLPDPQAICHLGAHVQSTCTRVVDIQMGKKD